jgi:hypothetical protein
MSDYYNLLEDSLRSGHLQVEKIYNAYWRTRGEARSNINIRTGYPMKYRKYNPDYIYAKNSNFPLCWNSELIGRKYPITTVERLLSTYDRWVMEYQNCKDNDKIKDMIEEEMLFAKGEAKNKNNIININKFESSDSDISDDGRGPKSILEEDEDLDEDDEEDSFIVPDIIRNKMVFKKSLGKRSGDKKIEISKKEEKKRLIIKKKYKNGISEDELNFIGLNDFQEEDEDENEQKSSRKKRLVKNGNQIISDDFNDFQGEVNEQKFSKKKRLAKNGNKVKSDDFIVFDEFQEDEDDDEQKFLKTKRLTKNRNKIKIDDFIDDEY